MSCPHGIWHEEDCERCTELAGHVCGTVAPSPATGLTDEQIDAIAAAQDDEGWFTGRLTKLEWRAFARDVLRATSGVQEFDAGLGEPSKMQDAAKLHAAGAALPAPLPMEATREMVDAACKAFGYPGGDRSLYARAWKAMAEHASGVQEVPRG